MTRADCCRRPAACPAHQNGDCDLPTPAAKLRVDEPTAAFLQSLYGDDWADLLAAATAGTTR